jgi:hypothetical protein
MPSLSIECERAHRHCCIGASIEGTRVMILGMSISTFTTVHVVISLVAIGAGLVVFGGMVNDRPQPGWTALFLATTVLTSVTGFMFPLAGVTPAVVFGVVSLVVLAIALAGLYVFHLAGAWRWLYVVTALFALYLNVVVLVVQSFQKLALLQPLAPTQSEPPFLVTQVVVLGLFLVFGFLAVRRFRPSGVPA